MATTRTSTLNINNGNLTAAQRAYDAAKTFGVPTVLLIIFAWWFAYRLTPPVLDAVKTYVTATVEMQREIVTTQKQIVTSQDKIIGLLDGIKAATDEGVVIGQDSMTTLMKTMSDEHAKQLGCLEAIQQILTEKRPVERK